LTEVHAYWLLDGDGQVLPDAVTDPTSVSRLRTIVIASQLASKNLLLRLEECQKAQSGKGGIPLDELLPYMQQAADAIDHLNQPHHELGPHKVGIQHRDIKPGNLLLIGNVVKVSDFGLAKILEGRRAVIEGPSIGITLSYAAPEVFANQVSVWSDQYALAMTYFHLRVGAMPFQTTSPTQIFLILVEGELDLSPLPPAERQVIARATALEPDQRYPSCSAMVAALKLATDGTRMKHG
jgi:serine/threonine protein kinase